jgi:apolipoprotein D and lipocalin family protein
MLTRYMTLLTVSWLATMVMSAWAASSPNPVHNFALSDYMGTWYEVARLPNVFQNGCVKDTVVRYQLDPGQKTIRVKNQCTLSNGKLKVSTAQAVVKNTKQPGAWDFSFFEAFGKPLLSVPYWVLSVQPTRYAIVGQPGKQFGWVLARKPLLTAAEWAAVNKTLASQGYNPCQFKQYPVTNGLSKTASLCAP